MPSYRGVGKRELIASIRLANAFLKKLDLGPDTNRSLDSLLGQSSIDKLESARSDLALITAVKDTDLRSTLTRFLKVIRLHALADPPDAKGHCEAMDVYERLMSWSAFMPSQEKHPPSPMDEEINTHLVATMARLLDPEDQEPDSDAQLRLKLFMLGVKDQEALLKEKEKKKGENKESPDNGGASETEKWLTDAIPLIASLGQLGNCEAEIGEILRGNKLGALIMPLAFEVMLDLDLREDVLGVDTPITRYKVVFDRTGSTADEIKDGIVAAGDTVIDLMTPFFFSDEIEKDIHVAIENDGAAFSISIYTTRTGAQHLANSLPDSMRVFNSLGQRIPRQQQRPSPPAPGF
jgi:hypothetical protein